MQFTLNVTHDVMMRSLCGQPRDCAISTAIKEQVPLKAGLFPVTCVDAIAIDTIYGTVFAYRGDFIDFVKAFDRSGPENGTPLPPELPNEIQLTIEIPDEFLELPVPAAAEERELALV